MHETERSSEYALGEKMVWISRVSYGKSKAPRQRERWDRFASCRNSCATRQEGDEINLALYRKSNARNKSL